MSKIILKTKKDCSDPNDIRLTVQPATYQYLLSAPLKEVRVSAYFDCDYPLVQKQYQELMVEGQNQIFYTIKEIFPGSRTRQNVVLPGPMFSGEQLTLIVTSNL